MSANDRIEKYYNDIEDLKKSENTVKLLSEIRKLKVYIFKHQNDVLSEGAKSRLVQCISDLYSFAYTDKSSTTDSRGEDLREIVMELLADYCALPEGKLTTGKGKSKFLKYINQSGGAGSTSGGSNMNNNSNDLERFQVIDVDNDSGLVTVTCEKGNILEGLLACNNDVTKTLKELWANGDDDIYVSVVNSVIQSIF